MTYVNARLWKDCVKILSEDVVCEISTTSNKQFCDRDRKVFQLENNLLVWGRGIVAFIKRIVNHLRSESPKTFDQWIEEAPNIIISAFEEENVEHYKEYYGLPNDYDVDPTEAINLFEDCFGGYGRGPQIFFVGYSHQEGAFSSFCVQRTYWKWTRAVFGPDMMIGSEGDQIVNFEKELGRWPSSFQERMTCLGIQFYDVSAWSWTEGLDGPTVQHGKVYETTLTADGRLEDEEVGAFREAINLAQEWRKKHGEAHFPEQPRLRRQDVGVTEEKHSEKSKHPSVEQARPQKKRKIGRNEPCPCGSGKKYKKCCGK